MMPYVKLLTFKNDEDLQKQISSLIASKILAIIPQKYEKRDMGDSRVLVSVLIVYN